MKNNNPTSPCVSPVPCSGTASALLDIIERVFLEKADAKGEALSVKSIEILLNKMEKAPGYLPKFYEAHFRDCIIDNQKGVTRQSSVFKRSDATPCQGFGSILFNLLKTAFLKNHTHKDDSFSIDDIERIFNKTKKALEDTPELCQFYFHDCMKTIEKTLLSGHLNEQLSKVISATPQSISVGHVQTVGLDNIKSILGDKWDKLAEKVYEISERCIKQHLEAHDVLTKTKENEFIICFTKLSATKALLKTQAIERDLCQIFISNTARSELDEFNLDETGWEELANVNIQTVELELTEKDMESDDIESALFRKMNQASNKLRNDTKNILKKIADNCKICTRPILKLTKDRANITLVDLDPESRANAHQLTALSENKEKVVVELDRISLLSAATYLYDKKNLLGPVISVNVNFETLNTPEHLSKYIKICETFESEIKKKIAFNLIVPCSKISKDYILNRFKVLEPFCIIRSLHLQGTCFDYTDFRPLGISFIIFDYNNFLGSIRKDVRFFKKLSQHLQKFKSCLFVNNLPYEKNIKELGDHDVKLFTFRE